MSNYVWPGVIGLALGIGGSIEMLIGGDGSDLVISGWVMIAAMWVCKAIHDK